MMTVFNDWDDNDDNDDDRVDVFNGGACNQRDTKEIYAYHGDGDAHDDHLDDNDGNDYDDNEKMTTMTRMTMMMTGLMFSMLARAIKETWKRAIT